ncbi:MAG: hypothetical protein QF819_10375 [Gemmatimonadota bacterium]|nr:hypothetical protein [Gemmatimonadota bacterium]
MNMKKNPQLSGQLFRLILAGLPEWAALRSSMHTLRGMYMRQHWNWIAVLSLVGVLELSGAPAATFVPTYSYVGYGETVNSGFDGVRGRIQMKDSDNVTAPTGTAVWCSMGTCHVWIQNREWIQAGWRQLSDGTRQIYGEVKTEYGLTSDIRSFESPLPPEGLYKCRKNGSVYECIVDGFLMNSTAVGDIEDRLCAAVFAAEIQDTQDHVPGHNSDRVQFSECQVRFIHRPEGTSYEDGEITQPLDSAETYGAAKSAATLVPGSGWTFDVWDTRNQP